ncbi:bifunctional riboflavin kinase/FAD synthetase [Mesonia sp.]|uniref:bifunctional riboflavin kinase/FAD synthetase n=1 Tax=Mesonia sp. TaxID=1960830 RepID=UPI0017766C65|nr:bifunctional riboflavin kinase/FAD synthetase [Mesonia sp.]HIB36823.1 bifunctional riboflavin kinase/FAD synthetase [Mesonia sp.]HIO26446.1 bifunctional riboflavin kinase/FAD synthetase [Flavobacteriaceae bacterium]
MNISENNPPKVITIGTFDGVHIGHRKIIKRIVETAANSALESAVLTFFPHPRMVLQKEVGIQLINTIEERKKILLNTGIDHLFVYPFTQEFSRLTAQEYIEQILVKKLNAKKVIIGYDHRFGRNRNADIEDLKQYGKKYGFKVEEISKQEVDEIAVSSTKIRAALEEGEIEKANTYLGSEFLLSGSIVKGKGLGKGLGFPTANLKVEEDYKLIPQTGVYVVRSIIDSEEVFGMMNIGYNPTVGGSEKTIETYFFNLDKNLYGKNIQIEMLKRIREEKKFSSVEQLVEAMKEDQEFSLNFINQL